MKPKLITNQMIQNVKYSIEIKKTSIKQNNDLLVNLFFFIIIIISIYYLYYRYKNKNEILKQKKTIKQNFSNTLFNYYNKIKRQEIIDILNTEPQNDIFNKHNIKTPGLINMNNKEWIKKPLKY